MSEAPDPQAVEPAVEPVEIPAAEPAEAAPAVEAAETPEAPAGEPAEAAAEPEEPKKPKSPVAQLQGRVGHLTKTIHQRDEELAEARRQNAAYQALLAGQGKDGEAAPAAPVTPTPGSSDFATAVQAEARRIATEDKLIADSNAIFDAGVKAHGNEFKEAVTNLNLLGLMNDNLVEAALATDAPADVIHYLGTDPDEAARITSLPPIRMAAELTKLATKLSSQAKPAAEFSRAPAPIRPVGGAVKPEVDLTTLAKNGDMAAYAAARKAQGARFGR